MGMRDVTEPYQYSSIDSSMSLASVSSVLRGAGWALSLLLIVAFGGATSGAAQPATVASSVHAEPVSPLALQELRGPDSILTPSSTPEPTPSPSSTPASTPTPSPSPSPPPPAEALAAQPASEPAPPPPPPPPKQYADTSTAAALVTLTNDLRARNGLPPLAVSTALTAAAQDYATTMALNDWFAHQGPDGSTHVSRVEAAGYSGWSFLAENLYKGFNGDSAASILQTWATSPSHLSAMLSSQATEIGVGCYVSGDFRWCAQEFGAR